MEHLAPAFSAGGSPLQNLVQSNQCLQRGSTACRVRAAFFRSLIQRSGHNPQQTDEDACIAAVQRYEREEVIGLSEFGRSRESSLVGV